MIGLNGRQVNENLLAVRVDRRKARALLDPAVEAGFGLDIAGQTVDEAAITEFNLLFRLFAVFSQSGAVLEPPLGYGKDLAREHLTGLRNIYRRLARRMITSPCEGYVQQQEYLNALYVRGIAAAEKLIEPGPGLPPGPGKLPDDICFRTLGNWEPELVRAMATLGGGPVLVLTIPGIEMLEAFERANRPFLAVGSRDLEVALCQERFLRARLEDPLEFLRRAPSGAALTEYGMVLMGAPQFLGPSELAEAIRLVAAGMRPRAVLAVKVEGGEDAEGRTGFGPEEGEPGYERPYFPEFVMRLMEEAGLEVVANGPPMTLGRVPVVEEEAAEEEPTAEPAAATAATAAIEEVAPEPEDEPAYEPAAGDEGEASSEETEAVEDTE